MGICNIGSPNIRKSQWWSIGCELYSEERKEEIFVHERIELSKEGILIEVWWYFFGLEYPNTSPSYPEKKVISDHISSPSQECDDINIEHSYRCEKCCNNSDKRSLYDHESEHDKISSCLKEGNNFWTHILCEIHKKHLHYTYLSCEEAFTIERPIIFFYARNTIINVYFSYFFESSLKGFSIWDKDSIYSIFDHSIRSIHIIGEYRESACECLGIHEAECICQRGEDEYISASIDISECFSRLKS